MSTIAVVGLGFSGISVAYSLIKRGIKPVLFNVNLPAKASSVPLGILNPATGRRALPTWKYREGLDSTYLFLEEMQSYWHESLFKKTGGLRCAFSEELADAYKKSISSFSETTVEWLDANYLNKAYPHIYSSFGGIWIDEVGTVAGEAVCKAFDRFIELHQLKSISIEINSIESFRDHAKIITNESNYSFDQVIICTGATLPKIRDVRFSNVIVPVKGQLLNGELKKDLPHSFSLLGEGYLAQLSNQVVFGSTYEHTFSEIEPTESAQLELETHLSNLFPDWRNYIQFKSNWTGIRASTPDRMPFVGNFNFDQNLFYYIGNGSKGLIWSILMGEFLAEYVLSNQALPKQIDIKRFEKRVF